MENVLKRSIEIGGRELTLETGRMAKQAGGAVFTCYGDTMVLATATVAATPRDSVDFFPLMVDYEEKMYAVGKIPGGFIKREGRPSEKAVLTSRLIDRPLRPLFPKHFYNDVQVVTTVLSIDQDNAPDMPAMIGASAALHISPAPFMGPIAGVTVGMIDGQFIINPNQEQEEKSVMHISVAGTMDAVMMVEAASEEIPEEVILDAILFGHEEIKKIVAFINDFRDEAEKMGLAKEKCIVEAISFEPELEKAVRDAASQNMRDAMKKCSDEKLRKEVREELLGAVKQAAKESVLEAYPEEEEAIGSILYNIEKETMRSLIAKDKIRIDGRKTTEVRPISCEVGLLGRTHGSSLFTRGQTQILNACTLGTISDEQMIDGLGIETSKRYIHHYNFPPYSVGEARPLRSAGRREIGHGALAERALFPVIPDENKFPYTISMVSEAIESNGSTSMGSVCASTLSLMDAGVPISAPCFRLCYGIDQRR